MTLFLAPFFAKQAELDTALLAKFNLEENSDLYQKRVMAFQVELMECCNSWRGFKYWTENPAPKADLLEEYVDGMHFLLSLGNMLQESDQTFPSYPSANHPLGTPAFIMFAVTMEIACKMYDYNYYQLLVERFFDLGYSLGFTWDQITEAYNEKYKENIRRMNSGY